MTDLHLFNETVASDRLTAKEREHIVEAIAAVQALQDMVRSLLELRQLEEKKLPLQKTLFDLGELVETVASTIRRTAKKTTLVTHLPDRPVVVFADHQIIRRVIANLVDNALKFGPEEGPVRIQVLPEGRWVTLSVIDAGPGIPPELHDRIFERYAQAELRGRGYRGVGLGLTFCKLAVEAHGGRIGVSSDPGKGSTFWFQIPVSN